MRVLHVIPSVSPLRGGPSFAVTRMVGALRETGIDAEIATTNDDGPGELETPLEELVEHDGAPVRFFQRFSPPVPPIREFAYSRSFSRWLSQSIHQYDLIHVHAIFSYLPTATMAIARKLGISYVTRPLGQLDEWSLGRSAARKAVYLRLIEKRNLQGAAAIHCTSRAEEGVVRKLFPGAKTATIPHGIDPPTAIPDAPGELRRRHGLPDDEQVLLFLSRLHPKKGLFPLIEAIARCRHDHLTLILAGQGDPAYEAELRNAIAQAGIAEKTILPGFLSGREKQLHLQGANLFALPSHDENFGIAALEALAAGCPVLLTPGVDLASYVERHDLGIIADAPDADALTPALERFFNESNRWNASSAHERISRQTLGDFQWSSVADDLVALYAAINDSSGSLPTPGPVIESNQ